MAAFVACRVPLPWPLQWPVAFKDPDMTPSWLRRGSVVDHRRGPSGSTVEAESSSRPPSPMRSFPAPWSVIQPPNIHNDSRAQAESRRDIEGEHDFSFPVPPTFHLINRRDNTSSEAQTSGTGDPSSSSQPMGIPIPFGGPVVKSSYYRPAETLTEVCENIDNQPADEEEHDQNSNIEAQVRQADPGVVVSEDHSNPVSESQP